MDDYVLGEEVIPLRPLFSTEMLSTYYRLAHCCML